LLPAKGNETLRAVLLADEPLYFFIADLLPLLYPNFFELDDLIFVMPSAGFVSRIEKRYPASSPDFFCF
jgi:hypothetical protein